MNKQRGFTLIELVVVIIILGILAAVAVPKFIDLSVDAHNASAKGVAGALASGSAINYAARAAGNLNAVVINQNNICTVATLQQLLTGNSVVLTAVAPTKDEEFRVGGAGNCSAAATTSVVCTLTPKGAGALAQNATVMCAR